MSQAPEYPLVDGRRLSKLRQVLLRDIAALAPDWRGAQKTQGPDRAIVEIEARLAEEATKRLDKTPERDALAFLEMFDVAPPGPGAAQGVSVFALKKDKTAPVLARARTGIEIATLAGEPANFETTEDLRIQLARIERLATVDPAADLLEVAPAQVTSLKPDLTPRPDYELAVSAGPEATVISIQPPVGILPDDLLRVTFIGGSDPRFLKVVDFSADGLATLKVPMDGAGLSRDQVEKIERMTRLDAFAMPNRQEHGLYIGDKDVLNVKEPAEITLRFKPESISEILSPNAVEFEIWGTREEPGEEPEEAPRWHRLVRLAGAGSDLRLYKSWIGPVDKLKLGEIEEELRWIRIRPHDPIIPEDGVHPLTGEKAALDQVTMGILTKEPEDSSGDTISQAAYNGTPLPLTTAFLPFGSEPQRFDTFSLAAPEAFTKPGAIAALNFSLMDATLAAVTMAIYPYAERHLYGIGLNGRLQVLDLTEGRMLWREVGGPPEEEGSEVTLALDPLAEVLAYVGWAPNTEEETIDIVVARATTGSLVLASVVVLRDPQASVEEAVKVSAWTVLPDLPQGMTTEGEIPAIAVVPVYRPVPFHTSYLGFLTVAASGGVQRLLLLDNGKPFGSTWTNVPTAPDGPVLPRNPVLAQVEESATDEHVEFLTADQDGALWVLRIEGDGAARWFSLEDAGNARIVLEPGAPPAGLKVDMGAGPRLLVAGVAAGGDLHLWDFEYDNQGVPFTVSAQSWSKTVPGLVAGAVLRLVQGLTGVATDLPHVLGYQNAPETGLVFEWAPETGQLAIYVPSLEMTLSNPPALSSAAIFRPTASEPRALIAFGADDQALVRLKINPSAKITAQYDWIPAPPSTLPNAEEYDQILVERVVRAEPPSQSDREIDEVSVFATNNAGDDVIQLAGGTTDWEEPVRVFRAKSATVSASFDPNLDPEHEEGYGTLKGPAASTSEIPEGRLLVVRPTDSPDRYGIFTVASTDGGGELTVAEPDDLAALMGDDTSAEWQEIDEVGGPDASTADRFIGTLVEIGPVAAGFAPSEPKGLSLFGSPGRAVAAEVLSSSGQARILVLQGWGGPPPDVGELVKVVTEGTSAEALEVQSLSSNFSAPELSWEYFNGEGWKLLDKGFHDTTADFSRSGEVSFIVPRDLAPTEIGGQEDYWIRARLVGGDYGKPVYKVVTESDGTNSSEQRVVVDTSDLRPPEVARVTARFDLRPKHLPSQVVARNNLRDLDQTSANRLAGARFAMFEGADAQPLGAGGERAILLGMTRPLEPGSASLFVQVREQDRTAKLVLETLGPENAWAPAPLSGEDPTKGLHRTGLLRFNVTERPAQVLMFGKALHWLRMRVEDLGDWAPEITGIWLNGVQILQAETIRQELLTSSAGEPNLELQLLKPPVLPNSLELRVRERLSAEEAKELNAARREGEPAPLLDKVPSLPGTWVLWHRVDSLLDQPADARVYLLSSDGRLRFGDARNGRIPPAGRDNIRAFSYQSGGQRVETEEFAEAGLRGSVEGVEMVLAPEPIAGGTHPPSSTELVAQMPEALRHAGHGLSLSDLEALACAIDSEIAQVRAFGPKIPGGPVRLIVLARGAEENRRPLYSLAQRDNLRRELHAKMSDAYGLACLEVHSAELVAVQVTASLVARPGAVAALETDAGIRLRTYLHAALGGPSWNGWPPGRNLWPTDIRRALSELETLDRVVNVEILMPEGRILGDVQSHEAIATASVRDVTVLIEGEAEA